MFDIPRAESNDNVVVVEDEPSAAMGRAIVFVNRINIIPVAVCQSLLLLPVRDRIYLPSMKAKCYTVDLREVACFGICFGLHRSLEKE